MTHKASPPHAPTEEDVIPTDSISIRPDTTWHDGFQAGRAAALAELDSARAAIERLYGRPADVIDICDQQAARRTTFPALPTTGRDSRPVVFGHTYLVREAGDGVA